jgi:hypothetical protein
MHSMENAKKCQCNVIKVVSALRRHLFNPSTALITSDLAAVFG